MTFNDQIFDVFIGVISFFGLEEFFRVDSIEEGSGRIVAWQFAWLKIQDFFFVGGGFGHDEHIMRPNYYWLSRLGHQGGVHNSYLSLWMDTGILGILAYFGAIIAIIGRVMRDNYIPIAIFTSLAFNIYFESWLVASLNPFTIIYLTIITILLSNLKGEDYIDDQLETQYDQKTEQAPAL